jgi:hypothetical protein
MSAKSADRDFFIGGALGCGHYEAEGSQHQVKQELGGLHESKRVKGW